MERRSSFKECPKCGLRNKPSATQCDFCGQNLGSSDDWQQHIKDLESLNKMELRRPVDDRTSKRIESTIIRKDAPAIRNVEIKEAGNIGKVLRDLEAPPTKDRAREPRDEGVRSPAVMDKLRIKEAGTVPLVEKDLEEAPPTSPGTTIAEVLREPEVSKEEEPPKAAEAPAPPEPSVVEKVPDEAEEVAAEPPLLVETPPETENEEAPQADEPAPVEMEEATPAAIEPPEEMVPAKEVTVEVVQPPHVEVAPEETVLEGDEEVEMSSDDSRETIKLKLVEVEVPKERLVPLAVMPHAGPRATAAIAMLALGSVAYLVILALISIGVLDTAAGLGGGAVSSGMIIYGATVVYPSLRRKKEDEVYICPKCHEKVGEGSEGCPACGAEFESED